MKPFVYFPLHIMLWLILYIAFTKLLVYNELPINNIPVI